MKAYLFTCLSLFFIIVPGFSWAQVVTISGYVRNASDGRVLKNATILERQSGIGTITNQEGFYKLVLQKGEYDLAVSNNGFESYERHVDLSSSTTVEVNLNPEEKVRKKVNQNRSESKNTAKKKHRQDRIFQ